MLYFPGVVLFPQIKRHAKVIRAKWPTFSVLGELGMGLCGRTIYLVRTLTSATNIGLIYAACPLLILSLSAHIFRSPIFRVQMTALFVSAVEVLVIIVKSGVLVLKTLEFNCGDLLVVMSTLAFFFYPVGRKTVD